MKSQISLIPVIEFPTVKDAESRQTPTGTSWTNPEEWEMYYKRELAKNYSSVYEPIAPGSFQYRLFDLDLKVLQELIDLHTADLPLQESCAFFGGYVLVVDGQNTLYPQCCGLLSEIQDWQKLLQPSFEPFYLMEQHPSPRFELHDKEIHIISRDDFEPFVPITQEKLVLGCTELQQAVLRLVQELEEFSRKMDSTFAKKYGVSSIAEILLWRE
ncbi:MAG: hypothetical protein AAF518_06605 [Spirochaetota bacterium]